MRVWGKMIPRRGYFSLTRTAATRSPVMTSQLTRVARWMEKNIQEVLLDTQGVFVARMVVKQLIDTSGKGVENCWRQAHKGQEVVESD